MKRRLSGVFYGWKVVAACFAISLFINGIIGFGFTALVEPLSDKYGWSYTQISLATSLRGLEVGILAPLVGFLVDRWGSRRLILGGVILCGLAMLVLSRATTLATFYASFGLVALGMTALSPTVTMTTVAMWFRRRIGQATGIMHSGVGFSGLMLPVVVWLIDWLGISRAMVVLGVLSLVVVAPIAFIIKDKPSQLGLQPDGAPLPDPSPSGAPAANDAPEVSFTLRQAIRTPAFWFLAFVMLFQLLLVNAAATHMMPFLSTVGIERTAAGLIASAVPLASVLGRLGFGWLSDRVDSRYIMATGYGMMCLGLVGFTLAAFLNPFFLIPGVVFFSVGFGGNATVRASLLRGFYGIRNFGAIHGLVMGLAVVGNITGPLIAGWAFDTWQTYQGVMAVFSVVAIIPMVLMLTMPRPKLRTSPTITTP